MRVSSWLPKAICLGLVFSFRSPAQNVAKDSPDAILQKASIVDHNIGEALTEHVTEDKNFVASKQLPEDKQNDPKILVYKNGKFDFDWTHGQQARYLMESIRQGLHALQSVQAPKGFDIIALAGGREYWPKLRDISCSKNPGIRYYDLDGFEQYCPLK